MPNTPGAIGHGITGLYAAKGTTAADENVPQSLLSALGETVWVAKEELIDSVTAVSGSGPAYLFLMAEALTEAGVAEGLPRAQAEKFARATVAGAGALLAADKSPASALREAVTSPRRHHRSGAQSADGRRRAGALDEARRPAPRANAQKSCASLPPCP